MTQKFKSVFNRFLKVAIGGAITTMGMVTLSTPSVWADFNSLLNSLAIAGTFGAINGLLLAGQKYLSWKE